MDRDHNDYWHRVTISGGALHEKEDVLGAVLDFVNPVDLVPVKYTVIGKDSYFLARNCRKALEKFGAGQTTPIKLKNHARVHCTIQTCYVPVKEFKMNMQQHLKVAIEKRFDANETGTIDLTSFHREPGLYEVLYCPLSKPRFLIYVLNILKKFSNLKCINLSWNNIEDLKPLEVLRNFQQGSRVSAIDLSHNKVSNRESIRLIGNAVPELKEIILTGNPVCSTFDTAQEYVEWIKECLPYVKKVDGIFLNFGFPNHQFWLSKSVSWFLINEFIKQYFTLYDSDRKALKSMYNEKSTFSMSYTHHREPDAKGVKCRAGEVSHRSNIDIVNALCLLPDTIHEASSFKVDVMQMQETHSIFVVSGVFKDFGDPPQLRSFNRTFALKKVGQREYKIFNDLYHVTRPTAEESESFSLGEVTNASNRASDYGLVEDERKKNIVKAVSRMTGLNLVYAERCLIDCDWNIRKALTVFLENYKSRKIPSEAFTH